MAENNEPSLDEMLKTIPKLNKAIWKSCTGRSERKAKRKAHLLRAGPQFNPDIAARAKGNLYLSIQADRMTRGIAFGASSWRNSSSRVSA
jgi:hypothetical protein